MVKSILVGLCASLTLVACIAASCARQATPPASLDPAALKVFGVLPVEVPGKEGKISEEQVSLGRMLFYEPRLSRNQKISCNSCHLLDRYGVDGTPTSDGHKGKKGDRNAPTVYNAAVEFVQFWDGRAADVEEQAKGPILNPVEMGMGTDADVLAVIKSMPTYVEAFKKAFPGDADPVSYDHLGQAIGAFERRLITPSRWDAFLGGKQDALSAEEKTGLQSYLGAGCQACHAGVLLGGNMYQKAGTVKPWPNTEDPGRFKVTKQEGDRMMFKVPMLRNVAKTGPYFHDGKTATLAEAIQMMGEYQLGRQMPVEEIKGIETFLGALTGDLPTDYIKKPALPESTPETPAPSND